jgi:hypothetical protein
VYGTAEWRKASQKHASHGGAMHGISQHIKATRTEVWQQTSLQVALAYWVGFHPLFY